MGTKVVASAMARQHSVTLTFSAVGKLLQSQRCQNVKIAEPTKQLTWAANRRMLAEYPRWTCSPKHRQNKDGWGRREGQEGRVCFKSLITPPADNIQALGVATPLLREECIWAEETQKTASPLLPGEGRKVAHGLKQKPGRGKKGLWGIMGWRGVMRFFCLGDLGKSSN